MSEARFIVSGTPLKFRNTFIVRWNRRISLFIMICHKINKYMKQWHLSRQNTNANDEICMHVCIAIQNLHFQKLSSRGWNENPQNIVDTANIELGILLPTWISNCIQVGSWVTVSCATRQSDARFENLTSLTCILTWKFLRYLGPREDDERRNSSL